MDEGPIIAQAAVPVLPDDDAGTLAARVLAAEHRLFPLALRLVAEGRVRVVGERVEIIGSEAPRDAGLNPQPRRRGPCQSAARRYTSQRSRGPQQGRALGRLTRIIRGT